ncbi:MAG: DUF2752 domain-containing protein [Ilumatobacteraceae bacterium]|nr:DUF2752 domain-containing protein [Ilumatobacteraceae bacterium]
MTATVTSAGRGRSASLAAPLACGCCLLAGAGYVAANDPSEGGVFLPCPFRTLTGWWCPGCGLTRATHHLLRGDIVQALRFHLFVVVVLAAIVAAWAVWLVASTGRSVGRAMSPPAWIPVAFVLTLVAFAVVRNLPGIPGLRG